MLKESIIKYCKDFNERYKNFKITYWEIYNNDYILYIEDIKNEYEYTSKGYYDSDLSKCKTKEDYMYVIDSILQNDIGMYLKEV